MKERKPPMFLGERNTKEVDKVRKDKKQKYLETLQKIIEQKKKDDMFFDTNTINNRFLDSVLKNYPTEFDGMTDASSLLKYFENRLNYLRKELGLPGINIKRW